MAPLRRLRLVEVPRDDPVIFTSRSWDTEMNGRVGIGVGQGFFGGSVRGSLREWRDERVGRGGGGALGDHRSEAIRVSPPQAE